MLTIGQKIRYKKLGPGQVIDHQVREFLGQDRQFAVIHFPHREMSVQLPIGDPVVSDNLSPLLANNEFQKLLTSISQAQPTITLQRTWEQRRQQGEEIVAAVDPYQLAELLAAYAQAQGAGVSLSAADREMVSAVRELLAAELLLVEQKIDNFAAAEEHISAVYHQALALTAERGWQADNFEALSHSLAEQQPATQQTVAELDGTAALRPATS